MFIKKIQGEKKTERNKKIDSSEVKIPLWVATFITSLWICAFLSLKYFRIKKNPFIFTLTSCKGQWTALNFVYIRMHFCKVKWII